MRKYSVLLIFVLFFFTPILQAQTNLALNATPSASASSSGSYGPYNWNDGVFGPNSNFGWLGTDPNSFTTPAWLSYTWNSPQTLNRIRFYKPDHYQGNFVLFQGSAVLQFKDSSNQWVSLDTFIITNPYTPGLYDDFDFQTITTNSIRMYNFNITGQHNPGWDEIEVYHIQPTPPPPTVFDVGVKRIELNDTLIEGSYLMVVNVHNFAQTNADSFSVCYTSNMWGAMTHCKTFYKSSYGFPPAANFDSVLMVIDTLLIHPFVGVTFKAWTALASDTNLLNDTAQQFVYGLPNGISAPKSMVFSIQPNPTHDFIQVSCNKDDVEWRIFDLGGKLIMEGYQRSSASFSIDLSKLPNGNYILVLKQKGMEKSKKFTVY